MTVANVPPSILCGTCEGPRPSREALQEALVSTLGMSVCPMYVPLESLSQSIELWFPPKKTSGYIRLPFEVYHMNECHSSRRSLLIL